MPPIHEEGLPSSKYPGFQVAWCLDRLTKLPLWGGPPGPRGFSRTRSAQSVQAFKRPMGTSAED